MFPSTAHTTGERFSSPKPTVTWRSASHRDQFWCGICSECGRVRIPAFDGFRAKPTIALCLSVRSFLDSDGLACPMGPFGRKSLRCRRAHVDARCPRGPSRVLYIAYASPVPSRLGPARRHYHVLEQLARFYDVHSLPSATTARRRPSSGSSAIGCTASQSCSNRRPPSAALAEGRSHDDGTLRLPAGAGAGAAPGVRAPDGRPNVRCHRPVLGAAAFAAASGRCAARCRYTQRRVRRAPAYGRAYR